MRSGRAALYGVAAAVLAVDRLTKWLIETRMGAFDTVRVIPGFFDIVHSTNRGVAFGMFNDSTSPWRTALLTAFSLAAVVLISAMLWKANSMDRLTRWALALVLGGAAGNVYDRIVFGRVTDFLDFYVGDTHWPAFNVADSAIVVGCCLLALDLLKPKAARARHDVS